MDSPPPPPPLLPPNQPGPAPYGGPNRPAGIRPAVFTLAAAVVCFVLTGILCALPFALSGDSDPNETGAVVFVLWAIFPGLAAIVLSIVTIVLFAIRRPGR